MPRLSLFLGCLLQWRGNVPVLRRMAIAGLLFFAAAQSGAADNDSRALEAQIKAAYLYKFAGYVEWPPNAFMDATMPFTIGIIGAGDIATELNKLTSGRSLSDHPVEVRLLKAGDLPRSVQLIFVSGADTPQLRRTLEPYKALPTLTVSDIPGGIDAGCVINFMLVDNRVRFEISVRNAERHGLKISSRLLAVAQRGNPGASE
ncbi:YfiR family protein [Roseateles sp. P5_E1]